MVTGVGLQCTAWPTLPLEDPEAKSANWLAAFFLPPTSPIAPVRFYTVMHTHTSSCALVVVGIGIGLGSYVQSFQEQYVGQERPQVCCVCPGRRWHEPVFGAHPSTTPVISGWPRNGTCFVLVLFTNRSACIFFLPGGDTWACVRVCVCWSSVLRAVCGHLPFSAFPAMWSLQPCCTCGLLVLL